MMTVSPTLPDNVQTQINTDNPYQSYVYAYPHKTAYRPLNPALPLRDVWSQEDKSALFLYMHIPFCEIRCGFCNLFTTKNPATSLETAYLNQLETQAQRTKNALGDAQFARMAIGGGTPTYLLPDDLARVFHIAENIMDVDLENTPISVETSPLTATPERLKILHEHHVNRVSIGVQSFLESETRAAGRPQKTRDVHQALTNIRVSGAPVLNIDLIYGLPGQTVNTWLSSLRSALHYQPEEVYLYPLYVRPLTGMDKMNAAAADNRLDCYRAGRDLLLSEGYQQVSMRMFQKPHAADASSPVYCCQEDGMIGLGCGARSYTRQYHYSTDYAVGRQSVLQILQDYVQRPAASFDCVDYGFHLNADEQKRRYLLKSLLHDSGLSLPGYAAFFGAAAMQDFPDLHALDAAGYLQKQDERYTLTAAGLELSDAIGAYFYSDAVQHRMKGFDLR